MIVTLTVNPAVDKTFFIDDFTKNALNRAKKVTYHAGSKGINVSRVMQRVGIDTVATGFAGGYGGELLKQQLAAEGVAFDFVKTAAGTRVNTKVADGKNGTFTDINEPGGSVTEAEVCALFDKIDALSEGAALFHMGGSLQPNLPDDFYRTLIRRLSEKKVRCALDCGGKQLACGIEAKPAYIKPNELELSLYAGRALHAVSEIVQVAADIHRQGVAVVLVSLGENGSVCVCGDGAYRVEPLAVDALGTAGAGDSYFSGFLYGAINGRPVEDCLRLAASFAAAKVQAEGTSLPEREVLFADVDRVIVRRL